MLWLILCAISAGIWAISIILDNYLSDVLFKGRQTSSMKGLNGVFYLFCAVLTIIIFGIPTLDLTIVGLMLLAGFLSAIASLPYYRALKDEESTTAAIFFQLIPFFYLIADGLIFRETITPIQLIAFVLMMTATAVVIFSRRRARMRKMEYTSALLFIAYDFFIALSGIITTHIGETHAFTSIFFWFLIGRGVTDVLLYLFNPSWRKRIKYICRHHKAELIGIVGINQIICVIAEFASRYALIIGIAAVVSATNSIMELVFTFILGIVLSIIWPKFGREKLSRHIIIAHLIAVVLATIAIILIH